MIRLKSDDVDKLKFLIYFQNIRAYKTFTSYNIISVFRITDLFLYNSAQVLDKI